MKRRTKKKKHSRWTKVVMARHDLLKSRGFEEGNLTGQEKRTLARLTKKIVKAERGW
jgi:hypothetical protein